MLALSRIKAANHEIRHIARTFCTLNVGDNQSCVAIATFLPHVGAYAEVPSLVTPGNLTAPIGLERDEGCERFGRDG